MERSNIVRSYRELVVWQKGMELVIEIYKITDSFPRKEVFGIVSQMRRSCVSIPSNIAEGWMRQYTKEYIQFLFHALGSCGELDTQIVISVRLGYIDNTTAILLEDKIDHIAKMLRKMTKLLYLRKP